MKRITGAVRDCLQIFFEPDRFFSRLKRNVLYEKGFRFALRNIFVFSVALGILLMMMGPDKRTFFVSVFLVFMVFFAGVAELFIFSFSMHVFFRALGGKGSFEDTFGVVAYSSAVLLYAWVFPLIAFLPFHVLYIASSGFARVHGMSRRRSAFAAVLPVLICAVALYVFSQSSEFKNVEYFLSVFYSYRIF